MGGVTTERAANGETYDVTGIAFADAAVTISNLVATGHKVAICAQV